VQPIEPEFAGLKIGIVHQERFRKYPLPIFTAVIEQVERAVPGVGGRYGGRAGIDREVASEAGNG
jgi:hypothetical protein